MKRYLAILTSAVVLITIGCAMGNSNRNPNAVTEVDVNDLNIVEGANLTALEPQSFTNKTKGFKYAQHDCIGYYNNGYPYSCALSMYVPPLTQYQISTSDSVGVSRLPSGSHDSYFYSLKTPTGKDMFLSCNYNYKRVNFRVQMTPNLVNRCFAGKFKIENPNDTVKVEPIKHTPPAQNQNSDIQI